MYQARAWCGDSELGKRNAERDDKDFRDKEFRYKKFDGGLGRGNLSREERKRQVRTGANEAREET